MSRTLNSGSHVIQPGGSCRPHLSAVCWSWGVKLSTFINFFPQSFFFYILKWVAIKVDLHPVPPPPLVFFLLPPITGRWDLHISDTQPSSRSCLVLLRSSYALLPLGPAPPCCFWCQQEASWLFGFSGPASWWRAARPAPLLPCK